MRQKRKKQIKKQQLQLFLLEAQKKQQQKPHWRQKQIRLLSVAPILIVVAMANAMKKLSLVIATTGGMVKCVTSYTAPVTTRLRVLMTAVGMACA